MQIYNFRNHKGDGATISVDLKLKLERQFEHRLKPQEMETRLKFFSPIDDDKLQKRTMGEAGPVSVWLFLYAIKLTKKARLIKLGVFPEVIF